MTNTTTRVTAEGRSLHTCAQAPFAQVQTPMNELLTPEFISRSTRFATAEEMVLASGLGFQDASDFSSNSADAWNQFIRRESPFPSWNAMNRVARGEWMWRRLGL